MADAEISFYDVRRRESVTVPFASVCGEVVERVTAAGKVQRRFVLKAPNGRGGQYCKFVGQVQHARLTSAPSRHDLSLLPRLVVVRDLLDAAAPGELAVLNPREFEVWVAGKLKSFGFTVALTPATRDGGVDIYASRVDPILGELRYLVECKHPDRRKVGPKVVRELLGLVSVQRATGGLVVTSGFFTVGARKEAQASKHLITLHDGDVLAEWIRQSARTG